MTTLPYVSLQSVLVLDVHPELLTLIQEVEPERVRPEVEPGNVPGQEVLPLA